MKIAVVILNWNGKSLLEKFLPSVIKYSPKEKATIYLADNASSDDSIDYVTKNYKNVVVVKNTENGGYSKGYNDALKRIDADIFCLINSDIEVTENWLNPIEQEFLSNEQTAIIQPKILDFKNKKYFEYAGAAGGFVDQLGYPYCRGRIFNTLEEDQGQFSDRFPIFWASGACLFIRSKVFWELGALDEDYFAHQEEIDLCWRAFNKNYQTIYIGESVVYHVGGASLSHTHWRKTYLNFRNSLFNLVKNAPQNYCYLIFQRMLLDGLAALKFLMELKPTHAFAIVRAHVSFYRKLPIFWKKRKQLLEKRTDYYQVKSIVWSYFFNKKQTFKDVN